jgi:hypothetical protein
MTDIHSQVENRISRHPIVTFLQAEDRSCDKPNGSSGTGWHRELYDDDPIAGIGSRQPMTLYM